MNNNGAPNPRGRSTTMAMLRAVVSGYLIYLGGSLIYDHVKGKSEMVPWMVWVFGIFFILAGAAFGLYTWKRYQKEKAELDMQEPAEAVPEPEETPEETEKPEEAGKTEETESSEREQQ